MDDSVAHVTFEIIQETLCITCCITPNNREKYIRRERRFLFWTCNETHFCGSLAVVKMIARFKWLAFRV